MIGVPAERGGGATGDVTGDVAGDVIGTDVVSGGPADAAGDVAIGAGRAAICFAALVVVLMSANREASPAVLAQLINSAARRAIRAG